MTTEFKIGDIVTPASPAVAYLTFGKPYEVTEVGGGDRAKVYYITDDDGDRMVFADEELKLFGQTLAASVNALVADSHGASRAAGWWKHDKKDLIVLLRDPESGSDKLLAGALVAQKLCLIHSEVSEAMEGHRKGLVDDKLPHRPMIEVELADAMIRILDLAGALGLDLGGAYVEKRAFNDVRPDHKTEAREAAGGKAY